MAHEIGVWLFNQPVLPGFARRLHASPPFTSQSIVVKIVALIEQRSALTVRRLLEKDAETRS